MVVGERPDGTLDVDPETGAPVPDAGGAASAPRGGRRGPQPHRRRRRWLMGTGLGVLVLLVVWIVGGYFVVVHPKVDAVSKADAILVLGPVSAQNRVHTAFVLARKGYAPTIVVSLPDIGESASQQSFCKNRSYAEVVCFHPSPATTRGEAREIAKLSAERGWHHVIVVTSDYHISRARFIVDRCEHPLGDTVTMVAAEGDTSIGQYAYQYLYQSVGYLKAFTQHGC